MTERTTTERHAPAQARFTRMQDSTGDDWRVIGADFARFSSQLPDRVLAHLQVARRRLRRLSRRSPDAFAADRDAAPRRPAATTSTSSARCCTTSATRSAASTTRTSRPRSSSRSCRSRTTGSSRSTASSRATTSSITSASIGTCATSSATIRGSTRPPSSAPNTTRRRSIRPAETFALAEFEPLVRRVLATPKRSIYRKAKRPEHRAPSRIARTRSAFVA